MDDTSDDTNEITSESMDTSSLRIDTARLLAVSTNSARSAGSTARTASGATPASR
jgi:hypothetical protein